MHRVGLAGFVGVGLYPVLAFPSHVGEPLQHIHERCICSPPDWQGNREHYGRNYYTHLPMKNLHLSREFAPRLVPALQELVGSRVTEVCPFAEYSL